MVKPDRINLTNLFLILVILGLLFYFNECKEGNQLTKQQGIELQKKSEEAISMMYKFFIALQELDSTKIINNYYTNKYETIKFEKDSILAGNPLLADSLFLYWSRLLRSEQSPLVGEVQPSDSSNF